MTSIISFDNRQILHFKPPLGSGATLKHASYPGVFHLRHPQHLSFFNREVAMDRLTAFQIKKIHK